MGSLPIPLGCQLQGVLHLHPEASLRVPGVQWAPCHARPCGQGRGNGSWGSGSLSLLLLLLLALRGYQGTVRGTPRGTLGGAAGMQPGVQPGVQKECSQGASRGAARALPRAPGTAGQGRTDCSCRFPSTTPSLRARGTGYTAVVTPGRCPARGGGAQRCSEPQPLGLRGCLPLPPNGAAASRRSTGRARLRSEVCETGWAPRPGRGKTE